MGQTNKRITNIAVGIAAASAFSLSAAANVLDASWLGGNGSWHVATNWSGGVVPNNAGGDSFHAVIGSGSVTTRRLPYGLTAIDSLDIAPLATLDLEYGSFAVLGQMRVDGSLFLDTPTKLGSVAGSGMLIVRNTLTAPGTLEFP